MGKFIYNSNIDLSKREESNKERERLYSKLYLGEIIDLEKPKFKSNNLILAPVGSGKSHLIENTLIPKDYDKKVIYLTSNTALKDSLCPRDSSHRERLAKKGKSLKFFTSSNKDKFGDRDYDVHVMTYYEFGRRIETPINRDKLLKNVEIVFCDEIHSLPTYQTYENSDILGIAMTWLFDRHKNIQKFFFTATRENIDKLEERSPGYLAYINVYDYLDHPKIRKYVANNTVYINHIEQARPHLKMKKEAFEYYGHKGLAFTNKIKDQIKIEEMAKDEGFKPVTLWSINNKENIMNDEQHRVREYILRTGNIPEPYNILIINGAMQEGWNLYDDMMRLVILDTVNYTEQIQALGRIRRDVDLVVCKKKNIIKKEVHVPLEYLNKELTSEDKTVLYEKMNILNDRGRITKWPSLRTMIEDSGYEVNDETVRIGGKQVRVSIISLEK